MRAPRTPLVLVVVLLAAASLHAQPPRDGVAAPSCAEDLDAMRQKVEADYAGFALEVRPQPARRRAYDSTFASLRAVAQAPDVDCLVVLDRFARWFDDPHLFVYQSQRLDTAEAARRARRVRMVSLDERAARIALDSLARRAGGLAPIEGIWYEGALRLAVVPDPDGGRGRYVAVILRSDTSAWPVGAVRAEIRARADGRYDVDHWLPNFALRRAIGARIHKGLLLRLDPGMWGKAYPVAPDDSGLLDPIDAHRATFVQRAGVTVLSIPSHDPTYRPALDSLLAEHADALRAADRLVVDLRGNEGGSAGTTRGLVPYLASRPSLPDSGPSYRESLLLSSSDQIDYVHAAFGPDSVARIGRLVARMRAHPGALVPQFDSLVTWPATDADDSIIVGPRRVGVLVDRGTVSAAEVLVLQAKRSRRATVFGEPTAGALDYQSVNVVQLLPNERRWFLGYPTITASAALPRGGMRGKGIAPDVRLDGDAIAHGWAAIAAVDRALRRAQ